MQSKRGPYNVMFTMSRRFSPQRSLYKLYIYIEREREREREREIVNQWNAFTDQAVITAIITDQAVITAIYIYIYTYIYILATARCYVYSTSVGELILDASCLRAEGNRTDTYIERGWHYI